LPFPLRFAISECLRRLPTTVMIAAITAMTVASIVTTASLGSAAFEAREEALQPMRAAGIDVFISTDATMTAETWSSTSLDPRLLEPGKPFIQDSAQLNSFLPMKEDAVSELLSCSAVRRASPMQVISINRLSGVGPPRLVVPERTVDPLTSAEEANINKAVSANRQYLDVMRRLLAVQSAIARGSATPSQEASAKKLGQRLADIEFSYYPARFLGFSAETFAPEPVKASEDRIVLVGVDLAGDDLALGRDHVVAGRLPKANCLEAAITRSFARSQSSDVGDYIQLLGDRYAVTGIVAPPLGMLNGDVYVPLAATRKLTGCGEPNAILVEVDGAEKVSVVRQLTNRLIPSARFYERDDISAHLVGSLSRADAAILSNLGVLAFVLALGLAGTVAIVLIASVSGRARDIGTLSALGWSRWTICRQIMVEAALRTGIGIVIGLATAVAIITWAAVQAGHVTVRVVGAAGAISDVAVRLHPSIPWDAVAYSTFVAFGACVLAALAVTWAFIRRSPASLLSHEAE